MHASILFLYCFAWSYLGVIPPGVININAAKISVEQGRKRGLIFTLGACLIIAVQAGLAIVIAEFLNLTSDELLSIQKIGVTIFFFLSVYFLIAARLKSKPKELELNRKSTVFIKGIFFSLINVFPIPFYSFVCTSLTTSGNFSFSTLDVIIFISAIVLGSFMAVGTYVILFKKSQNAENFSRNANYLLSALTLIIAIFALFKLNV